MHLFKILRFDIQRYLGLEYNLWDVFVESLKEVGLFYIILFRVCQYIININNKFLKLFLKIIILYPFYHFFTIFLGIEIDLQADIGKGFYIGHFGDIHIGPVKIGKYCNVNQGVSIGLGRESDRFGLPTFGDYVWIGAGAKVFGDIVIGNNVSIGANSVVSKDIPDNAVVVGNPGRIVHSQNNNPNIQNVFEQ